MAYEPREGDIAIYLVKEKKNEKGPCWTGRALIDGKERDVSLWSKSDTMLAGQIKDKWEPKFDEVKKAVESAPSIPEEESEIPFAPVWSW